jgi:cytochrome d ubiquinol oxidase subunit II
VPARSPVCSRSPGLGVLQRDAHPLYRELIAGPGLPAVIVSGAAGVSALRGLVLRRRFQLARLAAALAVAAIVAGWALAEQPQLRSGLTVDQAAAPRDTLIAVIIAVAGGGFVVIPSPSCCCGCTSPAAWGRERRRRLRRPARRSRPDPVAASRPRRAPPTACLIGGFGFLTVAEVWWAHAIGVTMLLAAIALGLAAAAPGVLEVNESDGSSR